MEVVEDDTPRKMTARGWCALTALVFPLILIAGAGWYIFVPREAELATIAEMGRLPLPEDATVLHSSVLTVPWDSVYAHLRMSAEDFKRFRSEIDFDLTRDPDMVRATVGMMTWHHGDPPEWWHPDGMDDPLAAWASRPALSPGATWSRWVAILAQEKSDGTVEILLHATQDP
jgi:hypothetical protein